MADANIRAVITADDRASATLKGVGDNTEKMGDRIKTAMAVAGGAALAYFGKQSVEAFAESETALTQLEAVIKSTGQAAGVTSEDAIKLSKEIQNTTSVSDEAALAVENMALTFTAIHKDIFPQTVKAAIDMATAMNHGLKPSAEQSADAMKLLGKALQDPDAGLGALHRVGVNTEELKKKFEGINDTATKQKLILQELGTEFGGSATAQAKTFSGQMDQLKNKMNDFQEKVGEVLVNAFTPLINVLTQHPALLEAVTYAVLGLAAAFVALKAAALISEVITGVGIAISFAGGAATAATTAVTGLTTATALAAAPWVALASVAAAASIGIISAANKAKQAWDETNNSIQANQASELAAAEQVRQQYKAGKITKEQYDRFFRMTVKPLEYKASGGSVASGQPYIVGEQGQELFVPNQSGTIIPNNKLGAGGSTINITVQAGAFMGSDVEARKFAQIIMRNLQDIAGSKSMSVSQMLG